MAARRVSTKNSTGNSNCPGSLVVGSLAYRSAARCQRPFGSSTKRHSLPQASRNRSTQNKKWYKPGTSLVLVYLDILFFFSCYFIFDFFVCIFAFSCIICIFLHFLQFLHFLHFCFFCFFLRFPAFFLHFLHFLHF